MCRCLPSILFHVLLCYSVHSASAEPAVDMQAGGDFASTAGQMFAEVFGETESERQLLDGIVVSKEEERQIGEASLQDLLTSFDQRKIRVLKQGKDVAYLKSLVAEIHPLMANAKRYSAVRVYVVESTVTDARAFPGGFMVCSTGMIDFAQSEAALIGVLAHELSHIDRGHQMRTARSVRLAQGTWAFGNADAMTRNGILLAKQFAHPFRSEDEAEADLDAAKWIFAIGYDPMEFAKLFRRLHERHLVDRSRMPSFLRSHPYHVERYEAVRQFSSRLQADKPDTKLYVGRKNLQRRIPRQDLL